jgi:kynurenine formamidase
MPDGRSDPILHYSKSVQDASVATALAWETTEIAMTSSEDPDTLGTSRHIGPLTWARCAEHLSATARCYDLSQLIAAQAPMSPFARPFEIAYGATTGIPGTIHAGNGESIGGGITQQGTHLDALGHFGALPQPWGGEAAFPAEEVTYYAGLPQTVVKPDPNGGLARLGVDRVPPIVTTGLLLDAAAHLGDGRQLAAGFEITASGLAAILEKQRLDARGILPGDAVFIHTGWGRRWENTTEGTYYTCGPGLSADGAAFLSAHEPAVVGLDNPFTDPVAEGQLAGRARPPKGMPPHVPFGAHHHNLVEAGVLQIQNLRLEALAHDRVWLFAAIILPLRLDGASGSPVRPIAIGTPAG